MVDTPFMPVVYWTKASLNGTNTTLPVGVSNVTEVSYNLYQSQFVFDTFSAIEDNTCYGCCATIESEVDYVVDSVKVTKNVNSKKGDNHGRF